MTRDAVANSIGATPARARTGRGRTSPAGDRPSGGSPARAGCPACPSTPRSAARPRAEADGCESMHLVAPGLPAIPSWGPAEPRIPLLQPQRLRISAALEEGRRNAIEERRHDRTARRRWHRSPARPGNVARKPRSCACCSSSEPGSVMAQTDAAAPCVPKYSRCERVSSVEPDFEAATKRVRSRSRLPSRRLIAAGCVVSSTWKLSAANARRSTSGASEEPPIPSRTNASNSSIAASAKAFSSGMRGRTRSTTSSQPSQRSSPESVQSDAS